MGESGKLDAETRNEGTQCRYIYIYTKVKLGVCVLCVCVSTTAVFCVEKVRIRFLYY